MAQASATTDAYLELLERLAEAGLADIAEVSVKLSAVGQLLGGDGEKIATENAAVICEAALEAGTTVTIDMEDHTTTDSTLAIVRELRRDYPWLGAVLQAYLHRTEADCRDLAYEGSRIRLCKGAYAEPASVAHTDPEEIDQAYVRCLKILMAGAGYPMVATHDPRLVEIAVAAGRTGTADQGHLRAADALRHQAGRAAAAGQARPHDAALRAVRHRLVRLPGAPAGREAGQRALLRAQPRVTYLMGPLATPTCIHRLRRRSSRSRRSVGFAHRSSARRARRLPARGPA